MYLCICKLQIAKLSIKMKGDKIRHVGVVASITDECMRVRIEQTSACSGCRVSAHCSASEQKEKVIDVYDKSSIIGHHVGDEVVVATTMVTGMRAVFLGFVLPFFVLVMSLFIALRLTGNEGIAALVALCSLIPYYLLLYYMRQYLRSHFSFVVEK